MGTSFGVRQMGTSFMCRSYTDQHPNPTMGTSFGVHSGGLAVENVRYGSTPFACPRGV